MKGKRIIIVSVAILVIALIIFTFFFLNRAKTIEEILDISFSDIAYVMHFDEEISLSEFVNEYKTKKYEKYSVDIGTTAHDYYIAYDENNNIIFTLVDIGNRNLIFLKKGEFNINDNDNQVYRLVE